MYLAAILDAFSRRVVGWALRNTLSRELSLAALRMALVRRGFGPGLIHRSDRGVQYACKEYVDLLGDHGILISMSATGNPYENATEAQSRVGYFIEDVYNRKRLHSSLGCVPPAEFESSPTIVGCS